MRKAKTDKHTQTEAKPPRRLFSRRVAPLAVAEESSTMAVAVRILSRARDIRNAHVEGSYVFGDTEHGVFVQRIGSASGESMLRDHCDWLFGLYGADTADGGRVRFPSPEEVQDDIRAHYGWEQTARSQPPVQLDLFAA